MGSALLAWFTSKGAGLVLGALAKLLRDGLKDWRAAQALKQSGADKVAAAVNADTVETIDAMDQVARPSDDAVADSLRRRQF